MKAHVTAELVEVGPETANEWLANKFGEQRNIRQYHVDRLAEEMKQGKFRVSPDALLRVNGQLANGQHRLAAVVKSGTKQKFLVMTSNDHDLYKVLDSGVKRTIADALIGNEYAMAIPAIAGWVMSYDADSISPGMRSGHESKFKASKKLRSRSGHQATIDYCQANIVMLTEAARFCMGNYTKSRILPVSVAGAIHVIGQRANRLDETRAFLNDVFQGANGRNAAEELRNRLVANANSRFKMTRGHIFALAMKALKSYLQGTVPGTLKWVDGEAFPRL